MSAPVKLTAQSQLIALRAIDGNQHALTHFVDGGVLGLALFQSGLIRQYSQLGSGWELTEAGRAALEGAKP